MTGVGTTRVNLRKQELVERLEEIEDFVKSVKKKRRTDYRKFVKHIIRSDMNVEELHALLTINAKLDTVVHLLGDLINEVAPIKYNEDGP